MLGLDSDICSVGLRWWLPLRDPAVSMVPEPSVRLVNMIRNMQHALSRFSAFGVNFHVF